MDPLCHTLVGATLAESGLGRLSRHGTATLLIAANLPDVDVLTFFGGADFALAHRRGWTHGILAAALLPPLLTAAVVAWGRRRRARAGSPPLRPGVLLGLAYLSLLTHPLLDWLNVYGVRLLMPFDDRWLYGDVLFIVDPWLWLVLGSAVYVARAGRRRELWGWVSLAVLTTAAVAIGLPAERRGALAVWATLVVAAILGRALWGRALTTGGRRRVAAAAGALALLYVAAMAAAHAVAESRVRDGLATAGHPDLQRLMVAPSAADPWSWQVVAEIPDHYLTGRFRFGRARGLVLERTLPSTIPSAVVAAALRSPGVQGLRVWARFPFYEVERRGDGARVYILDARYTRRRTTGFGGAAVDVEAVDASR